MQATIPRLPAAAADYLASFNARGVAITAAGFVFTSANPSGAVAIWWCRHDDAVRLAKAAFASGDIEGVAARLHIPITPHDKVVERVRARTEKLDDALARANDSGLLKSFNAAYRHRRQTAQQNGQRYMTFNTAQRHLRQAITETIAAGGVIDKSIVNRALELRTY